MISWRTGDTFIVGIGRLRDGSTMMLDAPIKIAEGTMIKKGDIVLHTLSKLHFRCENAKHEVWMNANSLYIKVTDKVEITNFANQNKDRL